MSIVDMTLHGKVILNGKVEHLGRLPAEVAIRRLILLMRETPRRGFSSLTLHLSINDTEPEQLNESKLLAKLLEGAEIADDLELDSRWSDERYVRWIQLQNPKLMESEPADVVQGLRLYIESTYPDAPGLKK